jgi:hypothetical protein
MNIRPIHLWTTKFKFETSNGAARCKGLLELIYWAVKLLTTIQWGLQSRVGCKIIFERDKRFQIVVHLFFWYDNHFLLKIWIWPSFWKIFVWNFRKLWFVRIKPRLSFPEAAETTTELLTRVARFLWHNIPKWWKIYQIITTLPNYHKMYQMALKCIPLTIKYQHFLF